MWQDIVRQAMQTWNGAGSTFHFDEEAGQNSVVCFNQGRWNGRLGLTQSVPQTRDALLRRANTVLNTFWQFDPPHPDEVGAQYGVPYDLQTVVAHELGHMLVLKHSTDEGALMHPVLPSGLQKGLSQDDVDGIRYLYRS